MNKIGLILLLLFVITGCDDGEEPCDTGIGLIEKTTPIFEVLKGEGIGSGCYTMDPIVGQYSNRPPKHTSIIHILSQNVDSSINYKIYTDDSACNGDVIFYKEGTFKTNVSFYQGEEIVTISSNITSHIEPYDYLYCNLKGNLYDYSVNDLDFIIIDANPYPTSYHYCRLTGSKSILPFDSLKGEGEGVKTGGGLSGRISDADYHATIQILSQNADSSINFKSFVKHALYKEGTFMNKLEFNCGNRLRIFDKNITSHDGIFTLGWSMYRFESDTLIFEDGDRTDSFVYYYAKVK